GNDIYAERNKSFGLTTLRSRHVEINGASLRFSFIGKSGKEWQLKVSDRRIVSVARAIQELPGQRLFQYLDEDGARREIRSQDVNDYIREITGPDFTSKHFRTWGATVLALSELAMIDLPATRRDQVMAMNAVLDKVARTLRNTRAVCRQCYVHPQVLEAWQEGRLCQEVRDLRRRARRPLKGLATGESAALRWLESA